MSAIEMSSLMQQLQVAPSATRADLPPGNETIALPKVTEQNA